MRGLTRSKQEGRDIICEELLGRKMQKHCDSVKKKDEIRIQTLHVREDVAGQGN